jgi:hypothetical protein
MLRQVFTRINLDTRQVLMATSNRLLVLSLLTIAQLELAARSVADELKTWDGKHSIDAIQVTAVYFAGSHCPIGWIGFDISPKGSSSFTRVNSRANPS